MANTPLSRAPGTQQRILHDIRAVVDASEVDLAAAGADPAQSWLVVRTTPDRYSGTATVPGVVLDGDSGRLVDRDGNTVELDRPGVVVREGSFEVRDVLSGPIAAGTVRRYSWRRPERVRTNRLTRQDVYDPFARPGTVVCRYSPDAAGNPFDAVRLMPEGWAAHVREAAAVVRRVDPADAGELGTLLTSPNHLLVARSVHGLAGAGRLDDTHLRALFGRLHGYRRAVLYFSVLRHAPAGPVPAVREALAADLSGDDRDHRRAAVLGVVTTRLFAPGTAGRALSGVAVLEPAARARAAVEKDRYVREGFGLLSAG
jgi:hypothetical protein